MKKTCFISLSLIALCSVSCSSHLANFSPATETPATYSKAAAPRQSRVLVKTGSLRLVVRNVRLAEQTARSIVKSHKGHVANATNSDDGNAGARLALRIPKGSLVPVMEKLSALGKVSSRRVEVEDVTEEWIDLRAKLKNMRALRDRLRGLLRQAGNVKETLLVEKELTRVQSELDSLEGRMKAMRQHADYSELSLHISRKSVPGPLGIVTKGLWWGLKKLFVLR